MTLSKAEKKLKDKRAQNLLIKRRARVKARPVAGEEQSPETIEMCALYEELLPIVWGDEKKPPGTPGTRISTRADADEPEPGLLCCAYHQGPQPKTNEKSSHIHICSTNFVPRRKSIAYIRATMGHMMLHEYLHITRGDHDADHLEDFQREAARLDLLLQKTYRGEFVSVV